MDGKATMALNDVRVMLERGRLAASRKDDRAVLHGVRITITDGMVQAMAADGFLLLVHRLDCEYAEGDGSAVLDLDHVAALLKALPHARGQHAGDTVALDVSDETIQVKHSAQSGAEVAYSYPAVGGTFPRFDNVVPRGVPEGATPTEQIAINGAYLATAAKMAALGGNSGVVRLNLPQSAKLPMSFTVDDGGGSSALLVVMPMFVQPDGLAAFVAHVLGEDADAAEAAA